MNLMVFALAVVMPTMQESKIEAATRIGKQELAIARERYDQAKHSYEKDRTEANKRELIAESLNYGNTMMNSPVLPPMEKYPGSLRLFRETLTLDPANSSANDNIALIEGIYESLGKPIPE
ncbi:MAG: hypothetical protein KDC26_02500 [Armatimonadetes bacterium]|nr:hypothetical protein [Armatimonadota bacterium]